MEHSPSEQSPAAQGPYTYSVDNSPYTTDKTYNGLAAGPHTVDVKDDNGCVYSTTEVIGSGTGPTDINVINF
jgi:hypothetical protein